MQQSSKQDPGQRLARVAIFDFDGTVMDGQSGMLFSSYLLSRHMLPVRSVVGLVWWGFRYKLHLPYRQGEARELVFRALAGRPAPEVDAIMERFYEEVLAPRLRPKALAEIARCHDEGLVCLLVSATFAPIAEAAAKATGMDGFVATKMERDARGNYTGEVDGNVVAGAEKYRAAERWCNEHLGPGAWELERAYADHHTDEDLLARSQEAFAVCPGKTLRPVAKRNGWTILDWGV